MNLSCDALAAPPSSGLFFVEDEVDDDEDDVDEQIGATKTTYDTDFIYNIEQNLYGTKVDDQITAVKIGMRHKNSLPRSALLSPILNIILYRTNRYGRMVVTWKCAEQKTNTTQLFFSFRFGGVR